MQATIFVELKHGIAATEDLTSSDFLGRSQAIKAAQIPGEAAVVGPVDGEIQIGFHERDGQVRRVVGIDGDKGLSAAVHFHVAGAFHFGGWQA